MPKYFTNGNCCCGVTSTPQECPTDPDCTSCGKGSDNSYDVTTSNWTECECGEGTFTIDQAGFDNCEWIMLDDAFDNGCCDVSGCGVPGVYGSIECEDIDSMHPLYTHGYEGPHWVLTITGSQLRDPATAPSGCPSGCDVYTGSHMGAKPATAGSCPPTGSWTMHEVGGTNPICNNLDASLAT